MQDYLRRAKDTVVISDNLQHNEHGFSSYELYDDYILIKSVYGDGDYWHEYYVNMAKRLGITKIRASVKRAPSAYKRRFKMRVIGHIVERDLTIDP